MNFLYDNFIKTIGSLHVNSSLISRYHLELDLPNLNTLDISNSKTNSANLVLILAYTRMIHLRLWPQAGFRFLHTDWLKKSDLIG